MTTNPCPITHLEIPAPDMARLPAFYAKAFGWSLTPMGEGYVLFHAGNTGGGFDAAAPVGDGGPVLVIEVPDIPAKLREVEAGGGKRLTEKTEIGGGHGFYAYFRDPCGNRMGLWSKT